MSNLIKTYRPPNIPKHRAELDKYVETPVQKDWLGQKLEVGDLVLYVTGSSYGADLRRAKVVGMLSKSSVDYNKKELKRTTVSIALEQTNYQGKVVKIRKQGTSADKLVKLNLDQTASFSTSLIEA